MKRVLRARWFVALLFCSSCGSKDEHADAGRVCAPRDCASLGLNCGEVDDGKGGCLDCGQCRSPNRCGEGGRANVCGCNPVTCASREANCGSILEYCSGVMIDCGTCSAPNICGGGGHDNVCGRKLALNERCEGTALLCGAGLACCGAAGSKSCVTAAGGGCPPDGPDLIVDAEAARTSVVFETHTFTASDCEVMEGCVTEGTKRLLRFTTKTPNIGTADLVLGDPRSTPGFTFALCHNHYHFEGYMSHRLLSRDGTMLKAGRKFGFCLEDALKYFDRPDVPQTPRFQCNNDGVQGIQRGWADYYHAGIACQFLDITGISAGEYLLELQVNPERKIREMSYDNNTATIMVTIPPP